MSIKIGIIGAGGMTNYHIPGFMAGGAEVAAIADVNQAAARRVASKFSIPAVCASVAKMLTSEKLDAVSVITPNKFHKPLAMQALAAGLHVFCEKPPAMNAAEIRAMAAAAKTRPWAASVRRRISRSPSQAKSSRSTRPTRRSSS
jgi:predicted dehydrogenase